MQSRDDLQQNYPCFSKLRNYCIHMVCEKLAKQQKLLEEALSDKSMPLDELLPDALQSLGQWGKQTTY